MEFKVRHGLEPHRIQGTLLADVSTEEDWKDRWTEIYLYRVDPGGAPTVMSPRSKQEALRNGGYLSYVIGQSLRTHTLEIRTRFCKGGVPVEICKLPPEAQPCPDCRPSFAFISADVFEEDMPAEKERVRKAREGITDLVRMEVTRHHIHTALTAEEIISGLTEGAKTTVPGEDLVRKAARTDPNIAAVLARMDSMAGEAI